MVDMEKIESELIAAGAGFEVVEEEVFGERVGVFKQRAPSLRQLLVDSVGHGDNEFLVSEDVRISFSDHAKRVASTAAVLRERYGVQKGDRVAILAANCPEWIVSFWATIGLGAVCAALNGWWVRDEILYGIEDSDPKVLIGDRKRLARLKEGDVSVPVIEIEGDFDGLWLADADAELPDGSIAEDDPATILYTSGTTGRPKGAVGTHRSILGVVQVQMFHGFRMFLASAADDDGSTPSVSGATCTLNTAPLFHLSGLYAGAITALAGGAKTVWPQGRFDPERIMGLIEREKVTNWGPMGTMLHRVLEHPEREKFDLSSIRNIGSGGAPMSAELQERAREVFPQSRKTFGLGYGLTECSLATLNFGAELEATPDSVGRPLPTTQIEIRDPEGNPLPEGEEGEIYLRSPQVMKEYWRKPEATAETICAGRWLRTGDFGRFENGRLYIASRKRDLILRGGENIYPIEIEQCLELHADVAEAAVVGKDHVELGQEVMAIVVPNEGASPSSDELRDWVAERLAYYKVPAHWDFRSEALPRNATGKVMKNLLVEGGESPFVAE